jgi:Anticodon-binding domain
MAAAKAKDELEQYTAAIDHVCAVELKGGEKFESVVWATSSEHKMVVFRQAPAHTFMKADYTAVNASEISSFVVKGPWTGPLPSIKELTFKDASKQLSDGLTRIAMKKKTRGVGVSAEAQAIFDYLHRMYDSSEWNGDQIVVDGKIIIRPPYGEADVGLKQGVKQEDKELDAFKRIKQMVSFFFEMTSGHPCLFPFMMFTFNAILPASAAGTSAIETGVIAGSREWRWWRRSISAKVKFDKRKWET